MTSGTPFWKNLYDHGIKVGLVNFPFTYSVMTIDAFKVSGIGSTVTSVGIVYPETGLEWTENNVKGFSLIADPAILRDGSVTEIFDSERRSQLNFIEIALNFSDQYNVDVLAINLLFPDHVNNMMPSMEAANRAICESDNNLNSLFQGFKPDNVMLFSDLGSRRVKGYFLLHNWLRDKGHCVQLRGTPSERAEAANWFIKQCLQV